MSSMIALDLASSTLDVFGEDGDDFVWPTPPAIYLRASDEVTSQLARAVYGSNVSEAAKSAAVSQLGMVMVDAERAIKAALDLHYAFLMGAKCAYDAELSPVTAFLADRDSTVEASKLNISDFFPDKFENRGLQSQIWNLARSVRSTLAMRLRPAGRKLDIQNFCTLSTEFLSEGSWDTALVRPQSWFHHRHAPLTSELSDLTQFAGRIVFQLLRGQDCELSLCRRAQAVTEHFASKRFSGAHAKACALAEKRLDTIAGDVLFGGTPKDIGRLLGWRYQQMGREVWRFAHGGDRAFFIDPSWSITEFPYVDRYYGHGFGEEKAFQARYDAGKIFKPPGRPIKFMSVGSNRHQKLWKAGRCKQGRRRSGPPRVVLVAGSFLGERIMGPLTFKSPDPIIADTQCQLIRILQRHGFDVLIKAHPKGLFSDLGIHNRFGISFLQGPFDPVSIEADCYLFDFAGSAFFDALASEKGIVLIDTGNRPWDETTRPDLEARCEIVVARFDDLNRARVDEKALVSAVEIACSDRGCQGDFAQKYFYGSSS